MTLSIVAREAETGQLGVAVETGMIAVGATVPWARAGVGAVATQAFAEPAYGARCLDALERGSSAAEALDAAREADPLAVLRQVGVVAADGTAVTTTGALCIAHAGSTEGDGFVVQANMMATPDVWPAMAAAFTSSVGSLSRRMLAALAAGETAGGDARGPMSAALLVVEGTAAATAGAGTLVDIRVDRADDPLGVLTKLLTAAEAYAGFNRAVGCLTSGDAAGAMTELDTALSLLPDEENMLFLRAGALGASGSADLAAAQLRALIATRPSWEVVIRSFADQGFMPLPPGQSVDDLLRR
jgi:uncharacterized Ntn-hydrolase superfamily protein